ncbi:hypothetical protein DNK48_25965 [Streptomyces malaysiensis subsp. malaysiensis]|nr:hypothetical protein DNK48_25965 [Streptomyces malaysiensis]
MRLGSGVRVGVPGLGVTGSGAWGLGARGSRAGFGRAGLGAGFGLRSSRARGPAAPGSGESARMLDSGAQG